MGTSSSKSRVIDVPESRLRRVGWVLFLAVVAVVPLIVTNFVLKSASWQGLFYDTTVLPKAAALVVLTWLSGFAWAVSSLRDRRPVRYHRVLIVVGTAALAVTISAVFSLSRSVSVIGDPFRGEGLVTFLSCCMLSFLALQYVDRAARVRRVCEVATLSGTVVAAYGLVSFAGFDPLVWRAQMFGAQLFSTMGNPDVMGAYLVLPLVMGLGLAVSETQERWRYVWFAAVGIVTAALVLTLVRAAWAGAIIALVVLVLGARSVGWRPQRVHYAALGGIAAIVLIAGVAVELDQPGRNIIVGKIASVFSGGTSLGVRFQYWSAALRIWSRAPILGSGLGTFRDAFSADPGADYFAHWSSYAYTVGSAHNYYLELLATVGAVGTACIVTVSGWSLAAAAPFGREKDKHQDLLMVAVWAAFVGFTVALCATVTDVALSLWPWILSGVLISPMTTRSDMPVVARRAVVALVGLAAAVSIVLVASWVAADAVYFRATRQPLVETRAAISRQAIALNPLGQQYRVGLAEYLNAQVSSAMESGQPSSTVVALARDAVAAGQSAADASPWDLRARLAYLVSLNQSADTSSVPDAPALAVKAAEDASARWPGDPQVLLQLGYALRAAGDDVASLEAFNRSADTDPRFAPGWVEVGIARERTGDVAGASQAYRSALALDPGNRDAADALARLDESGAP